MKNYFNKWYAHINKEELLQVISKINTRYKLAKVSPPKEEVFANILNCNYDKLKVVIIKEKTNKDFNVLLEKSIESYYSHHYNNDNIKISSITKLSKEGVLFLDASLTSEKDVIYSKKTISHLYLWKNLISLFIKSMSEANPGIIFILFGKNTYFLQNFIIKSCHIMYEQKISDYIKNNKIIPNKLFKDINYITLNSNNEKIKWYEINE